MLTKTFMQLKNFPTPSITFLINGPPLKSNHISWFTCSDIMVNILVVNNESISLYWKL